MVWGAGPPARVAAARVVGEEGGLSLATARFLTLTVHALLLFRPRRCCFGSLEDPPPRGRWKRLYRQGFYLGEEVRARRGRYVSERGGARQ